MRRQSNNAQYAYGICRRRISSSDIYLKDTWCGCIIHYQVLTVRQKLTAARRTEKMEHANVQVIREDDHTFRIEDGHVRFFLLEGEEKALLIDSGIATISQRIVWPASV